jgi:DNA-binding transcriptional regulator GbsR (MarR family)
MGRLSRLVDSGLGLIEELVERVADRDRIRSLQNALRRMNQRLLELLDENEELHQWLLRADSVDQSRLERLAILEEQLAILEEQLAILEEQLEERDPRSARHHV